jgi:ATP-binding cassette subfamily B protein
MLLQKAFFDALQNPTGRSILPNLSLGWIVIIYVFRGWVVISMQWLRTVVGASIGFWVSSLLRHNLMASILTRTGSRQLPESIGEMISTLRDDVDNVEGIGGLPLDLLTQLVFFGGGLTILLWVDVQVTLLVLVPTLVVLTLTQIGRHRLKGIRKASREATAGYKSSLGEALSLVQAVQVAGAEDSTSDHIRNMGQVRLKAGLRDGFMEQAWWALFRAIDALGQGLVLLAAASKLRNGDLTVGDLAMYVWFIGDLGEYLTHGAGTLIWYRLAKVSADRLQALLGKGQVAVQPDRLVAYNPLWLDRSMPDTPKPVKTTADRLEMMEVRELSMRFAASDTGLDDISFRIERGTLTVIVGRIGSGKTTLLRAILGIVPLDTGEVLWNGKRVDDLATHCVPPRVGYTPQLPVLLSDTLRENVLLGMPDDRVQLNRAIHRAVLERDIAGFPDGLDTQIGVRGMKLSGGQAQRVAAARMFLRDSELLVMDDISSALDVVTEQVLWHRMFEQVEQNTCLVVSHRRGVLERADQILVMEEGRLTATGTLDELLKKGEEMRELAYSFSE